MDHESWTRAVAAAIKADPTLRAIALHNDEENFARALEELADDAIIQRHEADGELFNAYFGRPGV